MPGASHSLTVPSVAPCPACAAEVSAGLESIDLSEQHSHYFPEDAGMASQLTQFARQSSDGYEMRRCQECDLEWASPMKAPNADWYELAYRNLDLYPPSRWEFERVLQAGRSADRVFDIGCGSGAFLRLCTAAGMTCEGAEFSPTVVARASSTGLPVRLMDLDQQPRTAAEGTATVVTAFHVLEHLSRPERLFEFASVVSAPNAILWVGVPSCRRPSRVFRERDILDQPPHHLTRWSERALQCAGESSGWQLLETAFEPLPLPSALWWISTRTTLYRALVSQTIPPNKRLERGIRLLNAPIALTQRLTTRRGMTGFTMLARFRKTVLATGSPSPM